MSENLDELETQEDKAIGSWDCDPQIMSFCKNPDVDNLYEGRYECEIAMLLFTYDSDKNELTLYDNGTGDLFCYDYDILRGKLMKQIEEIADGGYKEFYYESEFDKIEDLEIDTFRGTNGKNGGYASNDVYRGFFFCSVGYGRYEYYTETGELYLGDLNDHYCPITRLVYCNAMYDKLKAMIKPLLDDIIAGGAKRFGEVFF